MILTFMGLLILVGCVVAQAIILHRANGTISMLLAAIDGARATMEFQDTVIQQQSEVIDHQGEVISGHLRAMGEAPNIERLN